MVTKQPERVTRKQTTTRRKNHRGRQPVKQSNYTEPAITLTEEVFHYLNNLVKTLGVTQSILIRQGVNSVIIYNLNQDNKLHIHRNRLSDKFFYYDGKVSKEITMDKLIEVLTS